MNIVSQQRLTGYEQQEKKERETHSNPWKGKEQIVLSIYNFLCWATQLQTIQQTIFETAVGA